MAGNGRPRGLTAALLGALLLIGCSGSGGDVVDLDEVAPPSDETTAPVTTSTVSTTEPPETIGTLSERELAEADVREVVEAWFFHPYDTSKGDEGIGARYLTGLMLQRVRERAEQTTAAGEIRVNLETQRLQITDVEVDLATGFADVDACVNPAQATLDAESGETLSADDPSTLSIDSTFQMQLTDDGWKINDLVVRPHDDYVECDGGGR